VPLLQFERQRQMPVDELDVAFMPLYRFSSEVLHKQEVLDAQRADALFSDDKGEVSH